MKLPDLDRRAEIHDLVVHFYREVVFDELLEPMFNGVAEVDWAAHIPKLIDYWCRVLLGEAGYEGSILAAHQHVHAIEPIRPDHFARWFALFVESVDQGWAGPGADRAKAHAARIGSTLARRLLGDEPGGTRVVLGRRAEPDVPRVAGRSTAAGTDRPVR